MRSVPSGTVLIEASIRGLHLCVDMYFAVDIPDDCIVAPIAQPSVAGALECIELHARLKPENFVYEFSIARIIEFLAHSEQRYTGYQFTETLRAMERYCCYCHNTYISYSCQDIRNSTNRSNGNDCI